MVSAKIGLAEKDELGHVPGHMPLPGRGPGDPDAQDQGEGKGDAAGDPNQPQVLQQKLKDEPGSGHAEEHQDASPCSQM